MVNFISRGNGNWNKECFIDKDIIDLDIQLKIAFWDKEGEISSPWWEDSQDNQTVVVHYKLVKLKKKILHVEPLIVTDFRRTLKF